jgi:citrate lyase subunit beta / citryl-CoA lyase
MTTPSLPAPALLFCPADRPDRYQKAVDAADVVVIDLEDAVPPTPKAKAKAREALLATPMDPDRLIIRINAATSPEHAADLEALRATAYRRIMLPKTEHAHQLATLADRPDLPELHVVALCETPLGILNAAEIAAAPNTIALMWGAEDLIAAIGGRTSRFQNSGHYRDVALHARSTALLAAAAYGKPAIDSVYTAIDDLDGLRTESEDAAACGFALKACIHPRQVAVVRSAFQPDEEQIRWARRVLEAAGNGGAKSVDGQMIDAPLLRQAEAVLASLQ